MFTTTVRGWRGAFMPILDMPVASVTRAEVSEYNKFAEYYRANWGRMDPIIAGVKRTALGGNREQVVVDVLMSPFAPQHFAMLKQQLGPADEQQFAPIAGNMATLEVVMSYGRLFGGLCDTAPGEGGTLPAPPRRTRAYPRPFRPRRPHLSGPEVVPAPVCRRPSPLRSAAEGPLEPIPATGPAAPGPAGGVLSQLTGFGRLRDLLVGYIGTTGELGPLAILDLGIPPSDPAGYAASRFGGWRRQYERAAPSSRSSARCSKPSCRSFATRRPPGRRKCG